LPSPGSSGSSAPSRGDAGSVHGIGLSNVILEHLTDRPLFTWGWQNPLVTRPDFREVAWVRGYQAIVPKAPRLRARIAFLSGPGAFSFPEG
jgi:hypothetical protein